MIGAGTVTDVTQTRMERARPVGLEPAPKPGPLLRARTSIPPLSPQILLRRRLLDRLDEGSRGPLTVVSGAAGTGKTGLVSSWAAAGSPPGPVAWVSLDADAGDAVRFWSYLLEALRASGAPEPDSSLASLRPPSDLDAAFVERVLDAVGELPAPVVLVLEDVHEVSGTAAVEGLRAILRDMPPQLRLVLVSRADPALPLHRLRLSGELTEIRGADLAFTMEESAALFAQHDLDLSPVDLRSLLDRTEGWAAGLRLAALSLQGCATADALAAAVAAFAGDDRGVAEYLLAEVLEQQPPATRDFLLRTSIVDRLTADLADALTGGDDGAGILEDLERSSALTLAVDDRRGWYRYHRLYTEMLRYRLGIEHGHELAGLHTRAAHWFAGHGEPLEAVRHAIAAEDWDWLGPYLVRTAAPLTLGPDRLSLLAALRDLPDPVVETHAKLSAARAIASYGEDDLPGMRQHLQCAWGLLEGVSVEDRDPVEMLLALLDGLAAWMGNDLASTASSTNRCLTISAGLTHVQVPALDEYRALALVLLGQDLLWTGAVSEAEGHLRSALTLAEAADEPVTHSSVLARGHLALLTAMRGRLHEAAEVAGQAVAEARRSGWDTEFQTASAYLTLALVHQLQCRPRELGVDFGRVDVALRRRPDRLVRTAQSLGRVRAFIDTGGHAAAEQTLATTEEDLATWRPPEFVRRWTAIVRAELLLATGRPGQALSVLPSAARAAGGSPSVPEAALAGRALLLSGHPERAVEQLTALLADRVVTGVQLVEVLLVLALANDRMRRDAATAEALARAVEVAAAQDVRRPFLAGGARLAQLLEQHQAHQGSHPGFTDSVLRRMRAGAGPAPGVPAARQAPPGRLTDRELAVLRLLPTMMSNAEIAAELYLSVNTVKAHLKALYRKLNASSRREAVRKGRAAGLLAGVSDGSG